MDYTHKNRTDHFFDLNTKFASLSDAHLKSLLNATDQTKGWGKNQVLKIEKKKVFVKRIPLTDLEYQSAFSTKNIFELPTCYNYGVGSAGFGAFRELLSHIKTTNWVLSKAQLNFPLMYHYRILSCDPETIKGGEASEKYLNYWNNNANIAEYIKARKNAKFEIALILEHFPYTFADWFKKNQQTCNTMVREMKSTISFLQSQKIIHFDIHLHNVLTDGKKPYVTDFGLVLDKNFDLDKSEQHFFNQNKDYDSGEFIWSMGRLYMTLFSDLPENKKEALATKVGLTEYMSNSMIFKKLIQSIDVIHKDNSLKLHPSFYKFIKNNEACSLFFNDFFFEMRENDKKDTKFNNRQLLELLKKSKFN